MAARINTADATTEDAVDGKRRGQSDCQTDPQGKHPLPEHELLDRVLRLSTGAAPAGHWSC